MSTCALLAFLLQVGLLHRFSAGWGRPDLLALLAAFLALYASSSGALWGAFAVGVLRDMGSAGPLGLSSLALIPPVFLLLALRDRFFRGEAMDVGLALIFMLGFSLLEAFGITLLSPALNPAGVLRTGLGQSLLSAALAFPLFVLWDGAGLVQKSPAALG